VSSYRLLINYWRIFAKSYFNKFWTEIHDVTTIGKRNVCSFLVTLNAFEVPPLVWHGRCPGDTPIPAKPSQACLVWRSRLRCWCALAILVVSLEVVGRKHCPWRNPTGRNHTLSGLVTGVVRCRRCCLCPLHDQPIDLVGIHLGTPGSPYANVYVPPLPKTLPGLRERINTTIGGTSHKTCLRGLGGNGSIAWTSAVSHEGRTSNACKVTIKLEAFLFQMVVTSCVSVQYLWKYGFSKSSDNLYAPCILWRNWTNLYYLEEGSRVFLLNICTFLSDHVFFGPSWLYYLYSTTVRTSSLTKGRCVHGGSNGPCTDPRHIH